MPPPVPEDRLFDADEVAARLHVPVSWVREQARQGALPCIKLGRYTRFAWPDVTDYLAKKGVKHLANTSKTST